MEQREIQVLCDDLLDRFMAALNAHDSAAMDARMHFPHVRMAEGAVTVYDSLYIATCRDGEWRIQARSSFGP